jgi:hypothetical protein
MSDQPSPRASDSSRKLRHIRSALTWLNQRRARFSSWLKGWQNLTSAIIAFCAAGVAWTLMQEQIRIAQQQLAAASKQAESASMQAENA